MSKADSIAPFPADICREGFAHWVTGFCDGESSFLLTNSGRPKKPQPQATFRIALRADDQPVLELIRSFFGCGNLYHSDNSRSKIANAKPVCLYGIWGTEPLETIIVPHFQKYPPRTKKGRDFAIWREGVSLIATIKRRPWRYRPGRAGIRHSGTYPKWLPAEREHFATLKAALTEQRTYQSPVVVPLPSTAERSLFDGLP